MSVMLLDSHALPPNFFRSQNLHTTEPSQLNQPNESRYGQSEARPGRGINDENSSSTNTADVIGSLNATMYDRTTQKRKGDAEEGQPGIGHPIFDSTPFKRLRLPPGIAWSPETSPELPKTNCFPSSSFHAQSSKLSSPRSSFFRRRRAGSPFPYTRRTLPEINTGTANHLRSRTYPFSSKISHLYQPGRYRRQRSEPHQHWTSAYQQPCDHEPSPSLAQGIYNRAQSLVPGLEIQSPHRAEFIFNMRPQNHVSPSNGMSVSSLNQRSGSALFGEPHYEVTEFNRAPKSQTDNTTANQKPKYLSSPWLASSFSNGIGDSHNSNRYNDLDDNELFPGDFMRKSRRRADSEEFDPYAEGETIISDEAYLTPANIRTHSSDLLPLGTPPINSPPARQRELCKPTAAQPETAIDTNIPQVRRVTRDGTNKIDKERKQAVKLTELAELGERIRNHDDLFDELDPEAQFKKNRIEHTVELQNHKRIIAQKADVVKMYERLAQEECERITKAEFDKIRRTKKHERATQERILYGQKQVQKSEALREKAAVLVASSKLQRAQKEKADRTQQEMSVQKELTDLAKMAKAREVAKSHAQALRPVKKARPQTSHSQPGAVSDHHDQDNHDLSASDHDQSAQTTFTQDNSDCEIILDRTFPRVNDKCSTINLEEIQELPSHNVVVYKKATNKDRPSFVSNQNSSGVQSGTKIPWPNSTGRTNGERKESKTTKAPFRPSPEPIRSFAELKGKQWKSVVKTAAELQHEKVLTQKIQDKVMQEAMAHQERLNKEKERQLNELQKQVDQIKKREEEREVREKAEAEKQKTTPDCERGEAVEERATEEIIATEIVRGTEDIQSFAGSCHNRDFSSAVRLQVDVDEEERKRIEALHYKAKKYKEARISYLSKKRVAFRKSAAEGNIPVCEEELRRKLEEEQVQWELKRKNRGCFGQEDYAKLYPNGNSMFQPSNQPFEARPSQSTEKNSHSVDEVATNQQEQPKSTQLSSERVENHVLHVNPLPSNNRQTYTNGEFARAANTRTVAEITGYDDSDESEEDPDPESADEAARPDNTALDQDGEGEDVFEDLLDPPISPLTTAAQCNDTVQELPAPPELHVMPRARSGSGGQHLQQNSQIDWNDLSILNKGKADTDMIYVYNVMRQIITQNSQEQAVCIQSFLSLSEANDFGLMEIHKYRFGAHRTIYGRTEVIDRGLYKAEVRLDAEGQHREKVFVEKIIKFQGDLADFEQRKLATVLPKHAFSVIKQVARNGLDAEGPEGIAVASTREIANKIVFQCMESELKRFVGARMDSIYKLEDETFPKMRQQHMEADEGDTNLVLDWQHENTGCVVLVHATGPHEVQGPLN